MCNLQVQIQFHPPWYHGKNPKIHWNCFYILQTPNFLETKARVSEFKSNILLGLIWLLRGLTYKGKLGIELTCYYWDSYTQTMTLPIILTSSMCVGETWALSRVNQSRAEKYISFLPIPFLILMSGISRSVHEDSCAVISFVFPYLLMHDGNWILTM